MVLHCRENPNEVEKLQKIADKRKKFYKLNTNYKKNHFQNKDFLYPQKSEDNNDDFIL